MKVYIKRDFAADDNIVRSYTRILHIIINVCLMKEATSFRDHR
jgi:hypothetical protein